MKISLHEFMQRASAAGGLQTDDLLAACLPLLRVVAGWHEQDRVALRIHPDVIDANELGVLELRSIETTAGTRNVAAIEALQHPIMSGLQVVGHGRVSSDDDGMRFENLSIVKPGVVPQHPVYVSDYGTWEQSLEHHDVLVDIFLLGQLLASLALDLDFSDPIDLERFVVHRDNLFAVNPRIHPVIAATILEMTELNRHKRAADLPSLIRRLENYREQGIDVDVEKLPEFAKAALAGRRKLVKTHLRDRLFEISRRNRLLYFKPTQAAVNLTVASVPLVININSIRPEQLFVWQGDVAAHLSAANTVSLGKWLRFEDQPYLPAALDRLIADARRDRAEYGFAQLRLVIAFLHWHNLKDSPQERIVTPLLLLPVELSRKKGVRDQYLLETTADEAEINPVLRHHLSQLYNLQLPVSITLSETTLTQFHAQLQTQIKASEPAVTLRLCEQPEIELIHERARQRLAQFNRRQLRGGVRAATPTDYSYDHDNLKPLGLQLFRNRVQPQSLPQRVAAGGTVEPRAPQMVAAPERTGKNEIGRETFALREKREGNPYLWDFDLCSMTLGNFNYRKMSLVRDYGTLIDEGTNNEAFDRVFSVDPRAIDSELPPTLAPADEWPVVSGDATQRAAVGLARTGRSYIVQGPPGTGKSQTITNLIADYVARGQRVLFVCEKRAAIDVVFHRLRQQGLDELCCLIHDSQTDKKSFVQNLKQTYESWLAQPDGADQARSERISLLNRMQQDLDQLQRFDAAMVATPEHVGTSLRSLLHILVELAAHDPQLAPKDAESLPSFKVWREHGELARRLFTTLAEVGGDQFARHPFSALSSVLIRAERPLQMLHELTDRAEAVLDAIDQALADSELQAEHWDTLGELEEMVAYAQTAAPLAQRGQLTLLDDQSAVFSELKLSCVASDSAQQAVQRAANKNVNWRDKLSRADVATAVTQAQASESSVLRFLKPAWWRLKSAVAAHYNFASHAVRPSVTQVLVDLQNEYDALDVVEEQRQQSTAKFAVPVATLLTTVQALQHPQSTSLAALRTTLLSTPNSLLLTQLVKLAPRLTELLDVAPKLFPEFRQYNIAKLGELIRDLREEADTLPDLLPLLAELLDAPAEFSAALRRFEMTPDALQAASARNSLEQVYRTERWLLRFDGRVFERCASRIAATEREWLASNASTIRSSIRKRFREHVQLATTSVTQLNADERAFKKSYSTGRREVEHEFGKSMRFKSIRDLAAGDSGQVVRDLKPVWLMSPLSVSDTLPLETNLFDVVIFDEASQIPVEESVPALYRAPQVIVVGDEMQLPPTNFFSAASATDDNEIEVEEAGERIAITLDADSLLTQSAKNLPATLLAWHYRSRSESLIGFSNAAFYAGNLYTIPDRALPATVQPELVVRNANDAHSHAEALLARPLSFHYMSASPYENRRNVGEATYIAELVRDLLNRGTKLSIGVVAFSEAQQSEIESALDVLSAQDTQFAVLLEEAYTREEDDQFCGLFIKNLENVQGDERDIIILSICYGPDTQGRMLMNFGPINQRGGEKRLNVIFSRARHHMAVVSSIRHRAITNDYNDGAAALKSFLHYAERFSVGDLAAARSVLEGLNPLTRKSTPAWRSADKVAEQLCAALRARQYAVDEQVGQSRFRCDLAIRTADQRQYGLGVLIDTESYYANRNVAERCVTRPAILRAFGWQVLIVLTRDWYHEPQAVLDRIERALRGEHESVNEPSVDVPVPSVIETPTNSEPPTVPAISIPPAAGVRRCEFIEGTASKFWEIQRQGAVITIHYGRIGTQGQLLTKSFATDERAERELEKLLGEKIRKGYQEVT